MARWVSLSVFSYVTVNLSLQDCVMRLEELMSARFAGKSP
jgi:hypothetical protein